MGKLVRDVLWSADRAMCLLSEKFGQINVAIQNMLGVRNPSVSRYVTTFPL